MAIYPNNTVPIPTTGPHSNRSQELPARAQRTNQVQYVEERLRNGLSPLAVAGVAALLSQLDTMQTLPGVSVSLVTEVAGYRAPHMVLQTTTSAPVSDREPSGSRLPPIPNPELTGRSTSEQAVIVALQAVANYPNSSDFVRAVEQ